MNTTCTPNSPRILICIGGGPEALAGLGFAARINERECSDIALLYVRPVDSGLTSGGLEVRVARENMLDWGLELPGFTQLRQARDILAELGEIKEGSGGEWTHRDLSGDPAGEYMIRYESPCGGQVSLRLRAAEDVTSAVVDEATRFCFDLLIVGGSQEAPPTGFRKLLSRKSLALRLAAHAPCSVLVARNLRPDQGVLICVNDSERSLAMLPKAARFAAACGCPVTVVSVAEDETGMEAARKAANHAATHFREQGLTLRDVLTPVGDPVATIVEMGAPMSVIVVGESDKPWFARTACVAHAVAEHAANSVLVVK